MKSKAAVISNVCNVLENKNIEEATLILNENYKFESLNNAGRQYSELQKTKIFIRDGFIDRYSGEQLIFPPVLRILSKLMPDEFPFHKNWKMSECHNAYWQLYPTIDHVLPVSRGGEDNESNWVCTSQLRNSAKSNWLLDELGWYLYDAGDVNKWDGMLAWFMKYVNDNPTVIDDSYINKWYRAVVKIKL